MKSGLNCSFAYLYPILFPFENPKLILFNIMCILFSSLYIFSNSSPVLLGDALSTTTI